MLFVLMSFCGSSLCNSIQIQPLPRLTLKDVSDECGRNLDLHALSEVDIKNLMEEPLPNMCRSYIMRFLSDSCRVESDKKLVNCVDQISYLYEPPYLGSDRLLFIFGDLLVKKSAIHEASGEYHLGAKSLESILDLFPSEPLSRDLALEISRIYSLMGELKKATEILEEIILSSANDDAYPTKLIVLKALMMLSEIEMIQSNFIKSTKLLDEAYIALLDEEDCLIFGWQETARLRAELAKKTLGDNSFLAKYYLGVYEAYVELPDESEIETHIIDGVSIETFQLISSFCPFFSMINSAGER